MLTFTEEILLLVGDEEGMFLPIDKHAFECALAGAALMDLAFANRIDTDLSALVVTDATPTGNAMLDRILAKIAAQPEPTDAKTWIRALSTHEAVTLRERSLASLAARGILEKREERFLWAMRSVRYPTLGDEAERGIIARIEAVLSDEIPVPRDVALLSLVDACQILPELFPDREIEERAPRIRQLRKMDLIGREVAGSIADVQRTIVRAARAKAARFQKMLLALSVAGGLAACATLLVPRIPLPDRFGPTLRESLWFDGFWQQWSGYLLLGLSLAGLVIAVIIRKRLVARIAGSHRWRLSHIVLGIACAGLLFAHTGLRFGANINAALMGFYLAALLTGALVGTAVGAAPRLRLWRIGKVGTVRRVFIWVHVLALCPLPALLTIHILAAYLY